jgi:hypothetical protein
MRNKRIAFRVGFRYNRAVQTKGNVPGLLPRTAGGTL